MQTVTGLPSPQLNTTATIPVKTLLQDDEREERRAIILNEVNP